MSICLGCNAETEVFLSLGKTPLANSLLDEKQLSGPEPVYPLEVAFCSQCALVQLTDIVPPEQLFSEYLYFSSFSDALLQHARQNVERRIAERKLDANSLVIEIASNDGYLLQYYTQRGIPVLGIEPARNIAKVACEKGIPTVCDFFSLDLTKKLIAEGKKADVIHANNVFAHVPNTNSFVAGIAAVLKPTGIAVIEVPYLKDLMDHVEFDTIYHEHVYYFSLTAVDTLFRRHGLVVHDVERLAIHGGSLRIFASPAQANVAVSENVSRLLAEENAWNVGRIESYRGFGKRVETLKNDLCAMLRKLKGEGKRIAAYGASAKGSTLLNYFGIGRETLEFVADRSTVKQGRFTPGTHLPIVAPEKMLTDRPDYVLLLTWNFADEILKQQTEYRSKGGKFIIPIPVPKVM